MNKLIDYLFLGSTFSPHRENFRSEHRLRGSGRITQMLTDANTRKQISVAENPRMRGKREKTLKRVYTETRVENKSSKRRTRCYALVSLTKAQL